MQTSKLTHLTTRKTSVALILPEHLVDDIITHQWKTAQEATKLYNSLEISGLGRFDAREAKMINRITSLKTQIVNINKKIADLPQDSKQYLNGQSKIKGIEDSIAYLEHKLTLPGILPNLRDNKEDTNEY